MTRRLIVNIHDDHFTDAQAIALVQRIIGRGRISETAGRKHYCHMSQHSDGTLIRTTKRTETTDTFTIWKH